MRPSPPRARPTSLAGAAVVVVLLAGCAAAGARGQATGSAGDPTPRADVVEVVEDYALYTHCGVREARVGDQFFVADPVLDDGSGNPLPGWGRGSTVGTMTVYDDGTARFVTAGGLQATFRLRPGATAFAVLCS